MAGSDRSLRRVLLDNLLGAVSRNRLALDEMIGRLDRLSLAVRMELEYLPLNPTGASDDINCN